MKQPVTRFPSAHTMPRHALLSLLIEDRECLLCRATRILGSRDRAEDVLQEAAIRCLQSAAIDAGVTKAHGLIRSMVRNLALDQLRREKRECAIPLDEDPPCAAVCAENRLAACEALRQVVNEIDRIADRDRHIFLSHRVEMRPQKEIARDHGLSPARVNAIVARIHSRLELSLQTTA